MRVGDKPQVALTLGIDVTKECGRAELHQHLVATERKETRHGRPVGGGEDQRAMCRRHALAHQFGFQRNVSRRRNMMANAISKQMLQPKAVKTAAGARKHGEPVECQRVCEGDEMTHRTVKGISIRQRVGNSVSGRNGV